MKAHDYTTLAGIKDAMQELKELGDSRKLCCCSTIDAGIYDAPRILIRVYNRTSSGGINDRIWACDYFLSGKDAQSPADAFAQAEAFIIDYCTNEIARAEENLRAAQEALELAQSRAKKAQEGK